MRRRHTRSRHAAPFWKSPQPGAASGASEGTAEMEVALLLSPEQQTAFLAAGCKECADMFLDAANVPPVGQGVVLYADDIIFPSGLTPPTEPEENNHA